RLMRLPLFPPPLSPFPLPSYAAHPYLPSFPTRRSSDLRISIVTRDPLDLMLVITVLLRGRPHRSRPCRPRRELPDRHPHRSCPCRRRLPSHRVRHRG